MKPLAGIRVLDFSKVLTGPLCTQTLGDLGADIIEVEPLGLGDDSRGWPPFSGPGLGAVFLSVNRNKRRIALDLKTEAGLAVAHKLAKTADIAIENFDSGVAERLGIDAASPQPQEFASPSEPLDEHQKAGCLAVQCLYRLSRRTY